MNALKFDSPKVLDSPFACYALLLLAMLASSLPWLALVVLGIYCIRLVARVQALEERVAALETEPDDPEEEDIPDGEEDQEEERPQLRVVGGRR